MTQHTTGERLRAARKRVNGHVRTLCRALGISRARWYQYEAAPYLTRAFVERIAVALGVEPSEIQPLDAMRPSHATQRSHLIDEAQDAALSMATSKDEAREACPNVHEYTVYLQREALGLPKFRRGRKEGGAR